MKIRSLNEVPAIAKYLSRIGAEPRSLRAAVVQERNGQYWSDTAIIHFQPSGKIDAPPLFAPTDQERKEIEVAWESIEWPSIRTLPSLHGVVLPDELQKVKPEDMFEFRNLNGDIVMLQARIVRKGERSYIPWTFWSDNEWRKMEPEGRLPLWGTEQLKEHSTVFIHEGAKAAREMRDMVTAASPEMKKKLAAHPWGEELSSAAHIGWVGGALSPHRTDWSVLAKAGIKRAYIVSDNDAPGVSAVPNISFNLRIPTFHLQFTSEWPASFDLGDEFPAKFFRNIENGRYYVGPSFQSCLHPATWATDQIPNPKGKPTTVLRKNFKEMWAYVEEADMFVCIEMPEIVRTESIMNKMLSGFSHSSETSKLIVKSYNGRSTKLCYRPDIKGRIVTDTTTSAINLHTPTRIKPVAGSIQPFLDYATYMFPNETERKEVLRWVATVIGQPATRIEYGLLLVSERQGVGKTTMGASIIAPLVGMQNCSFPTESLIVQSEFNGWLANKKFILVNEIYSGHSWKAYQRLKSAITDREIEVNEKFQRSYVIENWAQIMACSNSMRALKMEEDDRRWFYPEVTEEKWPREKFVAFHQWLSSGGLGMILHWAQNFPDHILPGQPAPMTERKKELIVSSRTEGQQEAAELAGAMNRDEQPVVLAMKEVVEWVRQSVQGRLFDTDLELRKAMKEAGAIWLDERFLIGGRLQLAAMNRAAYELMKEKYQLKLTKGNCSMAKLEEETSATAARRSALFEDLRKIVKVPNDVFGAAM